MKDGAPRLPGVRRRRHLDDDQRRPGALRLPAGGGPAARGRGRDPRLPRARRLPAPAAQPDEVPDQGDGLGRRSARPSRRRWPQVRAEGGAAISPFDAEPPAEEPAPGVDAGAAPPSPADIAARVDGRDACTGPGIHAAAAGRAPCRAATYARWLRTNVRPQKQAGYVGGEVTVPLGDVSGAQLRVLGELASAYGDGTVRVTAEQDLVLPLGPARQTCPLSTAGSRPPASACPTPTRSPTSRAARAPSRASWPSRSRAASARRSSDTCARTPELIDLAPRSRHQDQRLPERLRPAPHRGPRLPGQRAQGRRQGGAAVLRDGRRRHRRRTARPSAAWRPRCRRGARRRRSSGWCGSTRRRASRASPPPAFFRSSRCRR